MTEATIQSIYRQFAEFHLRVHMAEVKSKYLPKSVEMAIADGFSQQQKIFKQLLTERLRQIGKYNPAAIPKLASIRVDYLNKLKSKGLAATRVSKTPK